MPKRKTQSDKTAQELLAAINSKVEDYLSCENAQKQEFSKAPTDTSSAEQIKQELQELLAAYFLETTPPDKLDILFGEVYSNVLDKSLATIKGKAEQVPPPGQGNNPEKGSRSDQEDNDEHANTTGNWFLKEFKAILGKNKREINRRRANQGYSAMARKDFIDKHIVALCEKYGCNLTGRPGGDKDKSDALNPNSVERFFRQQFEAKNLSKELADREIAQILKLVKNTHYSYDATMVSSEGENNYQVSEADKQADDPHELELLDAQRFIACAIKFYNELKKENPVGRLSSAQKVNAKLKGASPTITEEPAAIRNARFYLTFKLFMARPSDAFLKYIKDNTGEKPENRLIDENWYAYLQAYDKSSPIEYKKLLTAYIAEKQLPYKLSEGTAGDYASETERLLTKLQEEGYFQNLIS